MEAGTDAYYVKPLQISTLDDILARFARANDGKLKVYGSVKWNGTFEFGLRVYLFHDR